MRAIRALVAASLLLVGAAAPSAGATGGPQTDNHGRHHRRPVVEIDDARFKIELNATDDDVGIQVFLDARPWRRMSIFDPSGRLVFTTTGHGSIGATGITELFFESHEPELSELPLEEFLERFPEGEYRFRGRGVEGETLVGSGQLTHDIPDGPTLVSPLEDSEPQDPGSTTVAWEPVEPLNGSPIIGYQVIVEDTETGLTALPKIVLDVMMPPAATSMAIPPGFLQPDTDYEWEVLAIEAGGNQTLSSSTFTTTP